MMNLSLLKKADYTYSFGSEGTTFLFQNIVLAYYLPYDNSITYYKNGKYTVYLSNDMIRCMNERGSVRTTEETKKVIDTLEGLVKAIQSQIPSIRSLSRLDKPKVEEMFAAMREVVQLYEYFDYGYWDSIFSYAEKDEEAKKQVELVQSFKNVIRTELNPIFFDADGYLRTMMQKLVVQFSLPMQDLEWYTIQEVIGLFDFLKPEAEVLDARRKANVGIKDAKGYFVCEGVEAQALVDEFDAMPEPVKIIKGTVANGKGGIVRGVAFVMNRNYSSSNLTQKEMDRMKQGQILVSESTDPDLMPVLRKASVIITDTGGLLSHAAITARELHVPCIVGTRNASKILKDGDEVEIDMSAGTIKKVI